MRRTPIAWMFLLAALLMGATTPNKTHKRYFHFVSLNGRYVNADSGDQLTMYPSEEDTTGKGVDLTWLGGNYNTWSFTVPDSSEVWDMYETAGADTAIAYLQDLFIPSLILPESSVVVRSVRLDELTTDRLATDAQGRIAFDVPILLDAGDSLTTRHIFPKQSAGEYSAADSVDAHGRFVIVDTLLYTQSQGSVTHSGDYTMDGNFQAGSSALNTHPITGTLAVTGDVTVSDDLTIHDNATFNGELFDFNGFVDVDSIADFASEVTLSTGWIMDNSAVRDSLDGTVAEDTVLVSNVSDIIAAGDFCHCFATWNARYVDSVGNRVILAAPFSQTAATGDSVHVWLPSALAGTTVYYVVRCIGIN